MMRLWKVVVLVNVALGIGVTAGYLRWGREARLLRDELLASQAAPPEASGGDRTWTVRGIVRGLVPDLGAVILTHEAMPGLMGAMTMAFEADDPRLLAGLGPGDRVRFTVRHAGERLVLVAIAKDAEP
jgi:Cu/Ag efflux protein CusF